MFVEDVFNDQNILLLSANLKISAHSQIEHLRNQGVRNLYINLSKGSDVSPAPSSAPKQSIAPMPVTAAALPDTEREIKYYKELKHAVDVHHRTLETARSVLVAIRNGQDFNLTSIEKSAEGIVESIINNPDALISLCQIKGYDEYTYVHSVNVGVLMASFAHLMSHESDKILEAAMGGILHDIGKMRVPEPILNKPGKYTAVEFNVMKKHPEYGIDIIKDKTSLSDVTRSIIIQHHERFNGSGYPRGLSGESITVLGLMSAVVDVYDALTSERVYRAAWTPQKALALIYQGCDKDYHRDIVERFTRHLGIYPVGSFVRLKSGAMGVVTKVESGHLLAPCIAMVFDESGKRLTDPVEFDLSTKQLQEGGDRYKIDISLNPRAYQVELKDYLPAGRIE